MTTFEMILAETIERHWGQILDYAQKDRPGATRQELEEALRQAKGQFETGARSGAYAALRFCAGLMMRFDRREIAPKTVADMLTTAADNLGFERSEGPK